MWKIVTEFIVFSFYAHRKLLHEKALNFKIWNMEFARFVSLIFINKVSFADYVISKLKNLS